MCEGAKVQFSSQAAGEPFCSPAETGKRSLKLVGNSKRWHAKAGRIVLPPSARSRFASELGKSQAKRKTQPPLEKKVKDQSQLLDLLPWGHFPEVKAPALGLQGPARWGDEFLSPSQEAGASPRSCFSGWRIATQPQQSPSIPVPPPACLAGPRPVHPRPAAGGQVGPSVLAAAAWPSCRVPHG